MNTKLVNSAAGVVLAALEQNRTAAGIALALDSAQLLLTPAVTAELKKLQDRVAELEAAAVEGRAALAALCFDLDDPGTAALGALYLLQQATIGIGTLDPGETLPTVYRASHDSIPMGLYITAAAARAHCEAVERRSWATFEKPSFDWIEDEEDGVAEMTAWVGGEECETGYVVTALQIATEYDPDADE